MKRGGVGDEVRELNGPEIGFKGHTKKLNFTVYDVKLVTGASKLSVTLFKIISAGVQKMDCRGCWSGHPQVKEKLLVVQAKPRGSGAGW